MTNRRPSEQVASGLEITCFNSHDINNIKILDTNLYLEQPHIPVNCVSLCYVL